MTTQGAWPIRPFAEVADYGIGKTPARANADYWTESDQNIPWVSISDLAPYGVVTRTRETASRKALDEVFRAKLVPAGTLLMSFKLTIGRVATLGVPAAHNEAIISIYPRPGVNQRFLGYFLSQYDYAGLQDRQIKGNTLNKSKIDRIRVPVPSEAEQRQVADVLDGLRRAIDLQDAVLGNLARMRSAAMRQLFTRGLRQEVQKETEIGPIPESWELVPLGELGRIGNGSTPKRSTDAYWAGGTFPWLNSAKVYDRDIRDAEQFVTDVALMECHLPVLEPGAVLVAITGQGKTLGNAAVLNIRATINQHLAYLQTDLEKAEPKFVRAYLETQYDQLRAVASGGGSTKGALTCGYLRGMTVPRPPTVIEQQEIVEVLEVLDRKVDLHHRKRELLDQLFKSLLRKLMTGEVSVDDLDLSALLVVEGSAA